ncbi:unnamed protein product [Arctogadus glacialis]
MFVQVGPTKEIEAFRKYFTPMYRKGLAEILACNTAGLAITADSLWTQDDPEVPADGTIEGEVGMKRSEVKVRDNRT